MEEEKNKEKTQDSKINENQNIKHTKKSSNNALIITVIILAILIVGGGALAATKIIFDHAKNFKRAGLNINNFDNAGFSRERGNVMRDRDNPGLGYEGYVISGDVTVISGSDITLKDRNSKEYVVHVADNTSIRNSQGIAKLSDIQVNNNISVRGPSNSDGSVSAQLIIIR